MHYDFDFYDSFRVSADQNLIPDIVRAINGEYNAIICYEQLAGMAPNEEIKRRIMEIRQDEIRHYHSFLQLYASLTGTQATPRQTERCPADYRSGVIGAFLDEQKTVDQYLEIADKAHDPYIKELFKRTVSDEQNHAVWFLYFMVGGKK
ncbi:ferritin-like domain-containing protein [Paenibacillus macerans]|uniref:ferritin-like domain-containing protein n=1 Tax=Paenibacillus macerans TaxID=44252 RepID=UPI000ED65887|nr:ferritin-like domain-containing protein [Paenibacillus macerans]MBS5914713.1 ferritin-like domain-containing protein [Paenibacillus macerans]GBK61749.1 hypothetical protein PbDSM24746_17530 [Paenibacillus macerans]GBK68055.1 hypothetical protein PbJCM17693_17630 [Paenibacillus macerans]